MEKKKIINIDIAEVIRILLADKKKVCIYTFVSGVIGVLLAFGTPKTYKSTVVLAPEDSGSSFSGSISSLASMVGMNMRVGQTGDAIYPEIYPELMGSTDFLVGLFPVKVKKDKTGEEYTYMDYLQNHQKAAILDYPVIWLNWLIEKLRSEEQAGPSLQPDPFRLNRKEYNVMKAIGGNMECSVDKKTNVITIVVEDQDPLIAATVADSVQIHLQRAITAYRTKKAKIDQGYMEKLFVEAQQQYSEASRAYASYVDANQNLLLQSYRQKEEELENELQLKYNIYQQVVQQLQLAKAKVQERTPAFTIIQSASVPIKHSSRPKIVTLIIWMILGFMLRSAMLAWRNREKFISL